MSGPITRSQYFVVTILLLLFLFYRTFDTPISVGHSFNLKIRSADINLQAQNAFKETFKRKRKGILRNYEPHNVLNEKPSYEKDKPVILVWNRMFGKDPFSTLHECPLKEKCIFTEKRSYAKVADAIVFHSRNTVDRPHPRYRNQHQFYVFWTMEAPHHAGEWSYPDNFFNWTMSYSLKSDVYRGRLEFQKRNIKFYKSLPLQHFEPFPEELFSQKKRAIFGLISNCASSEFGRRMDIVHKIKDKYPVNLAGKCGWDKKWKNLCPKEKNGIWQDCTKKIEETINDHLFYFVLENSECWTYVTEKTFNRIHLHSIPIASRRSIYEPLNFPPKTFIFLDDFENVEQFSSHLRYLEGNKTAYMEYFQWRSEYGAVNTGNIELFCGLCRKLLQKETTPRIIRNPFLEYTFCYKDDIWKEVNN